jgi:hypothetical protein
MPSRIYLSNFKSEPSGCAVSSVSLGCRKIHTLLAFSTRFRANVASAFHPHTSRADYVIADYVIEERNSYATLQTLRQHFGGSVPRGS